MTRAERERRGVERKMAEHGEKAQNLLAKASDEDRDPTPEEQEEVNENLKAIKGLKERKAELDDQIKVEQEAHDLAKGIVDEEEKREPSIPTRAKTVGEQFTESEKYQSLMERGLSGDWKSGVIDLKNTPFDYKATLTEATGGSSGGDLVRQDFQPGILRTLFEPLTIADLIASGQTSSNVVRYAQEVAGSIIQGGSAVAEAADKPESQLVFNLVDEPVRKIATFLPVSDEMLEDVAQIQSYINERLALFVRNREEQQLLAGTGTAPEISGFLDRAINTWGRGTVDNNAVAIFKAANGTRGSSFLNPDAVVMNPANWQTTRLLTDTAGQFFGGGPFLGPYGGPQGPSSANRFTADSIWGMPVVVTAAIPAGTALVGAFRTAAQVFRRSGLSVEASNSHSDFFKKNLTAIRAEERLALAVYRPAAFTQVTGLN